MCTCSTSSIGLTSAELTIQTVKNCLCVCVLTRTPHGHPLWTFPRSENPVISPGQFTLPGHSPDSFTPDIPSSPGLHQLSITVR